MPKDKHSRIQEDPAHGEKLFLFSWYSTVLCTCKFLSTLYIKPSFRTVPPPLCPNPPPLPIPPPIHVFMYHGFWKRIVSWIYQKHRQRINETRLHLETYLSRSMTKPTKWPVRPAKTQISPVWSESSLSAWRSIKFIATDRAPNEDSIRLRGCVGWSVFAGRTCDL